jgi:hypothetical protein
MTGSDRLARPAVLLCAVLVAMTGACEADTPRGDPPACAVPASLPPGTEAPAGQAPGGGGLEVTDHGFTRIRGTASLGALIRNTSGQIAYGTTVALRLADNAGRDPVHEVSRPQLIVRIPVVRPGEQVAVGSWVGMRTDLKPSGDPAEVATFDVVLGSTQWMDANLGAAFPPFTSAVQRIRRSEAEKSTGQVLYSVTTDSCRQMSSRGAAAVFLDPDGSIAGGALEPGGGPTECGTKNYDDAIGVNNAIPDGIDEARTVVSLYCDLTAAPGHGIRPSGAPIN